MAYKWTDTETIQAYLDTVSTNLTIGSSDELAEAAAVLHENDAVFEIATILSAAWEGLEKFGVVRCAGRLETACREVDGIAIGDGTGGWHSRSTPGMDTILSA